MTSQIPSAPRGAVLQTAPTLSMMLLTPQEAGKFLKVSLSWLRGRRTCAAMGRLTSNSASRSATARLRFWHG